MKLTPKWAKGLFFLQESGLLIRQKHQFADKSPHCENCFSLPVVMYGCESWTIKKAEGQRIDALKLVLEKTLESSLDSKAIRPSIADCICDITVRTEQKCHQ